MNQIPVVIDRGSPIPLYHQLAEQLTAAVESGRLGPGDAFENELALADRLDLSLPTVRRAIAELVDRGLLIRRRGVGTRVASQVIHRRDELTSLYDDMERKGLTPTTTVLRISRAEVNAVAAEAFGLPSNTALGYLERLRYAGGTPTALMRNWLPPDLVELLDADLERGSLYALLRERGIRPVIAHQRIGSRRPRAAERKALGLAAGDPVLTMSRRAYAADGSAVEYGDHCYRGDQYSFDVTVHGR